MKIKQKIEAFGISLLLLSSFYFFQFTYFSLPSFKIIVIELLQIFTLLFFLNIIFLNVYNLKFKNLSLFFYLVYISIFILKLLFNASDIITLHLFIEKIFGLIFDWDPLFKPFWVKIISYLSPFLFITLLLLIFNKKFEKLKKFYSLLGVLIFFVVLYDLTKIHSNEYNKETIFFDETRTNEFAKKKVLWILYDALDPEFLEKKINNKILYENFNELKNNSVYFENAFSPGKFTTDSVPAQLMGINISSQTSKHRIKIFTDLEGKKKPFKFETTIFEKLSQKGFKVSLMSSVLEYCSSYLRSDKWKICIDTISNNNKNSIFNDSLKFFFSIYFKIMNYMNNSKNNVTKNNQNNMKINFENLNFNRIKNLEFNNSTFFSDQAKLINIENIIDTLNVSNMLFMHIYNPHLHPDSDYLYESFGLKKRLDGSDYFLRYLYTDLFTKKIIEEIHKNNLDDVLLIISSDHWWRNKEASHNDKDYIGNSFFLVKNLKDNSNFLIKKKSTTIIIPEIINKFLNESSFSNKDIFNYTKNLDYEVHIKNNRFE